MQALIIFALVVASFGISISTPHNFDLRGTHILEPCNVFADISQSFRADLYDFSITFYKAIAGRSELNFVYSPLSVWIMLSAMAEGADPYTQQQLFNILNLSNDPCIRQRYYQLATSRIVPSDDVKVINNRILLVDAGVTPNPTWYDLVLKNNLLDVLTAPIRYNPAVTTSEVKRLLHANLPSLNLNGNSILMDTVDYNALWTTEFADARIERAPFYDQVGNQVGFVDLMRTTKQARMGFIKSLKAKVLELPVGENERYRIIFAMFLETDDVKSTFQKATGDMMFDMFNSIKESSVPVEVAIPRMVMNSEIDVRVLVEDMGVTSLWNDPAATRNISHPPALPSSYTHRVTLTLDNHGLYSSPEQTTLNDANAPNGLDPKVGNDFIANRPFLFGLFDAETRTCMVASGFSVPTYKY